MTDDDSIREIKEDLLQFCRNLEVTRVTSDYSGSGDSGFIDDATLYRGETALLVADATAASVAERLDGLMSECYDGWFNDEGGCGRITVDVVAGTVTIEHNYYIETTEPAEDSPRVI